MVTQSLHWEESLRDTPTRMFVLEQFIKFYEAADLTSGFDFPKQDTERPSANKKACTSGLTKDYDE